LIGSLDGFRLTLEADVDRLLLGPFLMLEADVDRFC